MGKPNMNLLKGIEAQENAMQEIRTEQIEAEANKKQAKNTERMEQIPKFYNMGITSPELLGEVIAGVLKESKPIHKGTISNLIASIKETQPDLLTEPPRKLSMEEQRKLLEKHRGQTTQEAQTATEKEQAEEITTAKENGQNEAYTKSQKQVFSFRATLEDIMEWKAYSTATGDKIENLCSTAINEYIKNHSLTGAEKAIFDAMKARNEK